MSCKSTTHLILALLFTVLLTSAVSGQRGNSYFSEVKIAGSRNADQALEKARTDLEAGEIDRCVRLVQETIDAYGTRGIVTDSGQFTGIRDYCNDFLRKLPEGGLTTYRKIYDPYAAELYDRGLEAHDAEALKQVYTRYLLTSHGRDAMAAAFSIHLEQGRFTDAVGVALLYIETFGADDEAYPRAMAALVFGLSALGDAERIVELQAELTTTAGKKTLRVGDQEISLGQLIGQAVERTTLTAPVPPTPPSVRLFEEARWEASMATRSRNGDTPSRFFDFNRQVSPETFGWNPVRPAVDEGTVYVSNGIAVRAIGLYSGSEKWVRSGPVEGSQARRNISIDFPVVVDRGRVFTSLETPVARARRIWTFVPQQQVPHRQLVCLEASTGRVIWSHYGWRGRSAEEREFVAKLNINSAPLVIGDDVFVSATKFHTSYHHYLCCFSRDTGELKWSTFVCTGQMEQNMFGNRVREAIAGELAAKDGRIFYSTNIGVVAAVDRRLGTLEFTTEYEQIPIPRQERFQEAIFERAPSWAANAPIIVGDWVYVAPQDSLRLLAINRHSGRLKKTDVVRTPETRWRYVVGPYEDQLVIAGSNVAFFDTKSGSSRVSSISQVESTRRSNTRRHGVQGRPLIIGDRLYAAVRYKDGVELLRVWNLNNLKLIEEIRMSGTRRDTFVGNLAGNDEVVVIASTDTFPYRSATIRCYYDRAAVRRRLEAAVDRAPSDPRSHFRLGEFALQGNAKDYRAALERFERAAALSDSGPVSVRAWGERARDALHRLYLELARSHRAAQRVGLDIRQCFERALVAARDDAQRVEIHFYLLQLAVNLDDEALLDAQVEELTGRYAQRPYDYVDIFQKVAPQLARSTRHAAGMTATVVAAMHHEKRERYAEALSHYQRLLAEFQTGTVGDTSAWMFAFRRIESLLRLRGRDLYRPYERRARSLLTEARSSGDLGALERVLDHYPNATVIPEAYAGIAERHVAAGRHADAVGAIHDYLWRFRDSSPSLRAMLARSLETEGCRDSARQIWAGLRSSDAMIEIDGGRVLVSKIAAERIDALGIPTRETAHAAPTYGVGARPAWSTGSETDADEWLLVGPSGAPPQAAQDAFLAHRDDVLHCFGVDSSKPRWTFETSDLDEEAMRWFDGRLVGVFDDEITCIDAERGSVLWRNGPEELVVIALAVGHGKVYAMAKPRGFSSTFRVLGYGILDGRPLFDVSFEGDPFENIAVSNHSLMIIDNETRAHGLDALTGSRFSPLPEDFDFTPVLQPFFDAQSRVIAQTRGEERRVVCIDPKTHKEVWSRAVGSGSVSYSDDSDEHVLTYWLRSSSRASASQTVVSIDLASGVALLKRKLDGRVSGVVPTAERALVTCRATSKQSNSRLQYYCEAIDLATGGTDWRTLTFGRANFLNVVPFSSGVAVKVVERVRRSRRAPYRNKTTIYLVDGKSGRVEEEIELATGRLYDRLLTFAGERMIIADGPILRVYEP